MNQQANIPIVDIGSYIDGKHQQNFTNNLRQICKNIGFFYVRNHKIPIELQQQILQNSRKFFSLSQEEKNKIHMKNGGKAWRGYFQVGDQLTSGKIDLKQGLYLGEQLNQNDSRVISKTPLHGQNLFPQEPVNLKQNILNWQKHMSELGQYILSAISESLGLNKNYFKQTICKNHLGLLRIFHYPHDDKADPSLWAVGQHTDYGLITMLLITDKGLQVKNRQNQWINIDPISNTFVVNLGDILQRITNGLYKSTPHRVKNTQKRSRYSIPYFYDPGWSSQIKIIDIKVDELQKDIQKSTHQYKRWDQVDLSYLKGFYGDYLLGKVSKVFPLLAKENL